MNGEGQDRAAENAEEKGVPDHRHYRQIRLQVCGKGNRRRERQTAGAVLNSRDDPLQNQVSSQNSHRCDHRVAAPEPPALFTQDCCRLRIAGDDKRGGQCHSERDDHYR